MLQGLKGTNDLSLVVATAIATVRVGGSENENLFTTFEVRRQVLCADFAALILGVQEVVPVPRLLALLREMKHSLTEGHARALVAEAAVFERTGVSDKCPNYYFQELDGHVGIGCAELRGCRRWLFDGQHLDDNAVFDPGRRVIVRSFGVPLPVYGGTTGAMGSEKDSRVFDPGDNPTSFAPGLLG